MDPTERRKIRTKALLFWAVFTGFTLAFSFPSSPPPFPEFLFGFAVVIGISFVVGFPISYVLILAEHRFGARLRERWQRRLFPQPPTEPLAAAEPFRYSGRQWKWSAGLLAFVFATLAVAWLVPETSELFPYAMLLLVRWAAVALVAFAVPASFLRLRRMEYEVDDLGIRVRGRLRPFAIVWNEVDRLEVSSAFPFPSFLSPPGGMSLPKVYALWRKDGTFVGTIAPLAELPRRDGPAFESALLAYANRRGIPVFDIPWKQSMRTWKKRRNP